MFVHHEHGYAGRVDMVAKLRDIGWAVVDFKTQKVKRSAKGEPKPVFYETWPLQLAAYQQAILANSAKDLSAIVSVVIDSAQAGPVHVKVWQCGTRSAECGVSTPQAPHPAQNGSECAAPHPVPRRRDHLLPRAEKGISPVEAERVASDGALETASPTSPDYFGAFLSAFALWRYVKDYDPRLENSATPLAA